ncbi:hypothetical protein BDZ89DRAFT_1141424 [Hymenopellis radicata]|nr:hypothetical protein BDZ89DRAFT_1141424 [Hymenopellis radicata]
MYWNWCLNSVDTKNLALGICIVFVYGWFNHREMVWLVIWEAGICVELPPGVFLLYPSSLFFHFNVDLKDIEIPIPRRPEVSEEDWAEGNGRGSVVWFNQQASMFQMSETGFETLTMQNTQDKPIVSVG